MTWREEIIGDARLICADCRDVLPKLGPVDAVVTDPPYGIREAAGANASRSKLAIARDYGNDDWDNAPIDFIDMVRKSGRWAVIFGGNFYEFPPSSCWLVWDKCNTGDFADCELAWTNLPKAVRRLRYLWNGMIRAHGEPRGDHPTQKPVGVMRWAIELIPAPAETIIDPMMGSGTTGVACAQLGRRFVGIEIYEPYFDIACRRIEEAQRQGRLFDECPARPAQQQLFGRTP